MLHAVISSPACLAPLLLACAAQAAQVEQVAPPQSSTARAPQESYRLGKITLACDLPSGAQVNVVAVDDAAAFAFMAVRTASGPAILVNEHQAAARPPVYAVFSFYRECGFHALANVAATGPGDATGYDRRVVEGAECLAVIPTQSAFPQGRPDALALIGQKLREEHGDATAASLPILKRCMDADYAKQMVASLPGNRVSRQ